MLIGVSCVYCVGKLRILVVFIMSFMFIVLVNSECWYEILFMFIILV